MAAKKLVIGASGFLGSHVVRQLVAAGEDVRVMLRRTSSTRGDRSWIWFRSRKSIFSSV